MSDTQILRKNVDSQNIYLRAFNEITGADKTGDAANITAEISLNGAVSIVLNDNGANPTEVEATDHPGLYRYSLSAAENNADQISITAISSTANIKLTPILIPCLPIDANGRIDVGSWLGTAVTVSATSALPEVDTKSVSDSTETADALEKFT